MTDVIDLIDRTLNELCACGCGARLAADGPSAWFATETCQAKWHAKGYKPTGITGTIGVTAAEFGGAANRRGEALREFVAAGPVYAGQMVAHAGEGIVTGLPRVVESGRSILEDLIALHDRVLRSPYDHPLLPARIELDQLALEALRRHTVYQTRPPWPASVDHAFGIPVVVKHDMPLGGWRVLDTDGNVMSEGTVTA